MPSFLNHLFRHYPELLTALARALPSEKNSRVLDNICGAISRLIIANTNAIPINQVRFEDVKAPK